MKAYELKELLRILGITWEYFCSQTPELKHGLIYDYNIGDIGTFIKNIHREEIDDAYNAGGRDALDSYLNP